MLSQDPRQVGLLLLPSKNRAGYKGNGCCKVAELSWDEKGPSPCTMNSDRQKAAETNTGVSALGTSSGWEATHRHTHRSTPAGALPQLDSESSQGGCSEVKLRGPPGALARGPSCQKDGF